MIVVKMKQTVGTFAENKDEARAIRVKTLMPALLDKQIVELDFEGVSGATQSFVHALLSEAIREFGDDVYDYLLFKDCNSVIKEIIQTVDDYMQESLGD
jgi:hypothetical protein